MKIGIDARMYSTKFTGIGRYTYELIKNLLEIDAGNEYVIFLKDREYENFSENKPNVRKVKANFNHYSFKEQLLFPHFIKKENLDLMHFTHFNAPLFYRKPSVVTIHDLTLSFFPGKKMTSFMHRFFYHRTIGGIVARAKSVIAVSDNTKKDIMRNFPVTDEKITVIHEGVNSNFVYIKDSRTKDTTKEKFGLTKPFLLYTGVFRSHKNISGLIQAFEILKKRYKLDCDLVLTGKEDPFYMTDIEKDIHSRNLEHDIKFLGLVDERDLVAIYNLASLYVFPSLYEGFGLPPLEATACHTPVACSNTSSLPEICGASVLYFDPYSPADMAEKIAKLYRDKNLQRTLIEAGKNNLKRFSWRKMAEQTKNVYEKLQRITN